jgi:hypothetical protein
MSNIFEKIAQINAELPAFKNDGKNKQQGYAFISIYNMYNSLRKLMAKHGVTMYPSNILKDDLSTTVNSRGNTGYISNLLVEYTLQCGHEEGQSMTVIVPGFSIDYSDKAHNQAMTSAHKNALKQVFMIAEGDPDQETPDSGSKLAEMKKECEAATTQEQVKAIGQKYKYLKGHAEFAQYGKEAMARLAQKTEEKETQPA